MGEKCFILKEINKSILVQQVMMKAMTRTAVKVIKLKTKFLCCKMDLFQQTSKFANTINREINQPQWYRMPWKTCGLKFGGGYGQ